MFKNVISKLVKVGAIALIGNTCAAIAFGFANYHPTSLNLVTGEIYSLITSGVIGLVAAAERIINWNPTTP